MKETARWPATKKKLLAVEKIIRSGGKVIKMIRPQKIRPQRVENNCATSQRAKRFTSATELTSFGNNKMFKTGFCKIYISKKHRHIYVAIVALMIALKASHPFFPRMLMFQTSSKES